MQSHSLSRELALLMLGQVDDRGKQPMPPSDLSMEALLHQPSLCHRILGCLMMN